MSIGFAVLGDGAWGTAIALLLAQNPNHDVRLWSAREENGRILRERRENVRLLPGVPIPPSVKLTVDVAEAVDGAALLIVAVPTVYLRETLNRIAPALRSDCPVLSLSKGVEMETFLRPTEIIRQVLGNRSSAVLSGPSHAEEVSRGLPASLVAASNKPALARQIQEQFSTDRFRVYTSSDVAGVELGGALKNIIGIAAGISDGLGLGDNAKSALMIRGMVEIARFGIARGAERTHVLRARGTRRPDHDVRQPPREKPARRRAPGARRIACPNPGHYANGRGRRLHDAERPRESDAIGDRDADHRRGVQRPLRGQGSSSRSHRPDDARTERRVIGTVMLQHALKEWSAVCLALAEGRQSLILKKGGIAEAGGEFELEHRRFWLYPTYTHQQTQAIKPEDASFLARAEKERPPAGLVRLSHFAEVAGIYHVHDLVPVLMLGHLHILSEEAVRSRFAYRAPGLFVLPLRVYKSDADDRIAGSPVLRRLPNLGRAGAGPADGERHAGSRRWRLPGLVAHAGHDSQSHCIRLSPSPPRGSQTLSFSTRRTDLKSVLPNASPRKFSKSCHFQAGGYHAETRWV